MTGIQYIYKTINLINGKIYIGKHNAKNIQNTYLGSGVVLNYAIKKYGKNNFYKQILEICSCEDELNKKEKYWINILNSQNKEIGYNITNGGSGAEGYKHNPEIIKKLSENHASKKIGYVFPMQGKKHTAKTKQKISMANKGKKRSEDVKKKMSESRKGKNNNMYGRKHTKESIKKMSEVKKGKTFSDEHKRKISENHSRHNLGKTASKETREKISKNNARAMLGRKLSNQAKRKISKANTGKQAITKCIHCGKSGGVSNMTRYHFGNCKFK